MRQLPLGAVDDEHAALRPFRHPAHDRRVDALLRERGDERLRAPGRHGGDQRALADRDVGVDPDVVAHRAHLGRDGDGVAVDPQPGPRG